MFVLILLFRKMLSFTINFSMRHEISEIPSMVYLTTLLSFQVSISIRQDRQGRRKKCSVLIALKCGRRHSSGEIRYAGQLRTSVTSLLPDFSITSTELRVRMP